MANYNDLVDRICDGAPTPQFLVLLVLPDDPDEWLVVDAEQLVVRRTAFWYRPSPADQISKNVSTERIFIPWTNTVGLGFLKSVFAEVFEE